MTPFDAGTRHAVYIERLKASSIRDALSLIDSLGADVFSTVAASDLEDLTRKEVQSLVAQLNRMIRVGYEPVIADIDSTLREFGVYEGDWQSQMLVKTGLSPALGVASDADIWAAMYGEPFQGMFLKEWYAGLPAGSARRVRESVRQGYQDGRSALDVARDIRGTRSRKGIWDMSRRGADTMVRTAFNHTATVARDRTYAQNPSIRWEQWLSVLDSRTSAICRSRDGTFYPKRKGPRPPAHPACLTGDSLITASPDVTGVSKRWFDGEIVRIEASGDRVLTCTPNHPILTDKGWVAAGDLDFSHKIACRSVGEAVAIIEAENKDSVPSISEVTEAFLASRSVSSVPVPVSAPDFHGDGAGSKVAIVGAYGGLGVEVYSEGVKLYGNPSFVVRHDLAPAFGKAASFVKGALSASGSSVRRLGERLDFLLGRCVHARLLLLGSVALPSSFFGKYSIHVPWPDAVMFSEARNAPSSIEESTGLFNVNLGFGSIKFRNHIESFDGPVEDRLAYPRLAENILDGQAFDVELADLVKCDRVSFSGHVYNLQTVDGYYVANDIVTHNCRSTMIPVTNKNRAKLEKRKTYQDWLTAQSATVQDDILGKAKGELFRDGGLTVDRFVNRAGQEMTLAQLKAADSAAWEETFGDDSLEGQPKKAFTYDKVKAPKNTAELNDFIASSGIATSGRIKGSAKNYAEPMRAALEVVERFDAPTLDGVGPLSQYGYNGRVGAAAAVANLKYRDGSQKNYLYLPNSFGNAKNSARQFAANESQRATYTRASKAGIDRLGPKADPRVVSLFDDRVGADGISFARAFSIDGAASQNAIIYHEYGHVLMDIDKRMGPKIKSFLASEKPRQSGWQYILSRYGAQDDSEFVAESFSYYMAGNSEHWRIHPNLLEIFKSGDSIL